MNLDIIEIILLILSIYLLTKNKKETSVNITDELLEDLKIEIISSKNKNEAYKIKLEKMDDHLKESKYLLKELKENLKTIHKTKPKTKQIETEPEPTNNPTPTMLV